MQGNRIQPPTLKHRLAVATVAAVLSIATAHVAVAADSRDETLVVVTEEGPSTLDIDAPNANVETHGASWNTYDRLITHARYQLPDGTWSYDYTKFEPELAESWEIAPDGKSVTFHLRQDATFHDGTPVTAADVKWSFDRAVAVGGFPAIQMGASEMTKPDQFVVVDDHTIRVDFPAAEQADAAEPGGADRQDRQFEAGQGARHRQGSLGARLGRQERRRRRCLYGGQLEAGQRDRLQALRRLEVWAVAVLQEGDQPPDRFGRHAARAAREGRRRPLLQPAAEGLLRAVPSRTS